MNNCREYYALNYILTIHLKLITKNIIIYCMYIEFKSNYFGIIDVSKKGKSKHFS